MPEIVIGEMLNLRFFAKSSDQFNPVVIESFCSGVGENIFAFRFNPLRMIFNGQLKGYIR